MPDGSARLPARMGPAPGEAAEAEYIAIACTLRSGSNLLCDMLRANGFGEPKEWFQDSSASGPENRGDARGFGSDAALLARQHRAFQAAHAGAPWRGAKFDWRQFLRLRGLAPTLASALPDAAATLHAFEAGRWLYLGRRDLAAQAVSLYAAQVTDAWMGEDNVDYGRLPKDFDAIHERFAALAADAFAWDAFFRAGDVVPHRLCYEDLIGGGAAAWLAVMRHLDPDFPADRLDLTALAVPPRRDRHLDALKTWFRGELLAGRQPRSLRAVLEEIGSTVARVERMPMAEGVLGRFAADFIADPGGFVLRKLDLSADLRREGPAMLVEQPHFLDRVALRLDPGAVCRFAAPAGRVMLEFHAHAWSGIAEIRSGGTVETFDLFAERAATRHFIRDLRAGCAGTIEIRADGARHLLSAGGEVWLQRVFLLAPGGTTAEEPP